MITGEKFSVAQFIEDNFRLLGYLSWQGAISGSESNEPVGDLRRGLVFCDCSCDGQERFLGALAGRAMFVSQEDAIESLREFEMKPSVIGVVEETLRDYNPRQHIVVLLYTGETIQPLMISETEGMTPEECYNVVKPRVSEFLHS